MSWVDTIRKLDKGKVTAELAGPGGWAILGHFKSMSDAVKNITIFHRLDPLVVRFLYRNVLLGYLVWTGEVYIHTDHVNKVIERYEGSNFITRSSYVGRKHVGPKPVRPKKAYQGRGV